MVTFDDAPEIAARIARAERDTEERCRRVMEGIAHMLVAATLLYPMQQGFRTIIDAAIDELGRPGSGSRAVPPDDDQEDVE